MYIYTFVLITFCVTTITIISIFTKFLPWIKCSARTSVIHVSCILKLYVNFSKFGIVSRFNLYNKIHLINSSVAIVLSSRSMVQPCGR